MALVQWLDSLISLDNYSLGAVLTQSYPAVKDLDFNRLSGQSLSKLIKKIVSSFGLEPSLAPQLERRQAIGALRYRVSEKDSPQTRKFLSPNFFYQGEPSPPDGDTGPGL